MVDPRLLSYIRQMRQQGYQDEQIKQGLLQQNYPESLVKAAFSSADEPTVADSNILRHYIQTYLQQGYAREQIEQGLREQGYAEKDISRAFREATGGAQKKPRLPASMLIFTLLALVIIGGGLFFIMNFEFPNDEPLPPPVRTETRLSDIIENLIPLAANNPTAAVTLCNKVIEEDKDSCFKTVSSESSNPAVCEEISDARLRDACFMQYVYDGNKEFCDKLELPSNIEFCNTIRTLPETTEA